MTRNGYVAWWQGAEFEAVPDAAAEGLWVRLYHPRPMPGFDEVAPERYRRVVAGPEVQRLVYVRTVCTWHGEPFLLLDAFAGRARLEYTGGQVPVAELLRLERVERGVYRITVPYDDLRSVREEVVPVMAQ